MDSRLGHPSFPIVTRIVNSNSLRCSSESNKESVCDACQKAKSHQLPYSKSLSVSSNPILWSLSTQMFGVLPSLL